MRQRVVRFKESIRTIAKNAAESRFLLNWSQSEISNSRFNRSTMMERSALHDCRSALPNLTPLKVQFASARDLGVARSTKTPIKASQVGSELFTAFVIADSKVAHLICSLDVNNRLFAKDSIIASRGSGDCKHRRKSSEVSECFNG
jgi:hypothetical protein